MPRIEVNENDSIDRLRKARHVLATMAQYDDEAAEQLKEVDRLVRALHRRGRDGQGRKRGRRRGSGRKDGRPRRFGLIDPVVDCRGECPVCIGRGTITRPDAPIRLVCERCQGEGQTAVGTPEHEVTYGQARWRYRGTHYEPGPFRPLDYGKYTHQRGYVNLRMIGAAYRIAELTGILNKWRMARTGAAGEGPSAVDYAAEVEGRAAARHRAMRREDRLTIAAWFQSRLCLGRIPRNSKKFGSGRDKTLLTARQERRAKAWPKRVRRYQRELGTGRGEAMLQSRATMFHVEHAAKMLDSLGLDGNAIREAQKAAQSGKARIEGLDSDLIAEARRRGDLPPADLDHTSRDA